MKRKSFVISQTVPICGVCGALRWQNAISADQNFIFLKKDLTFQKVSAIIIASKALEQEQVSFFGTSRELPVGARQQGRMSRIHPASFAPKGIRVGCNGSSRNRTGVLLHSERPQPWDCGKLRWYHGLSRPLYSFSGYGGVFLFFTPVIPCFEEVKKWRTHSFTRSLPFASTEL